MRVGVRFINFQGSLDEGVARLEQGVQVILKMKSVKSMNLRKKL